MSQSTHRALGNKLPAAMENPIDAQLMAWSAAGVVPALRRWAPGWAHMPNVVTTGSFLCGLGACYALHRGHPVVFAGLWSVGYFLDVVDGQFARRYGLVTAFGDRYDHITDLTVAALLLAVAWHRYRGTAAGGGLWAAAMGGAVVVALLGLHAGCQQRAYAAERAANGDPAETLDALAGQCRNPEWIRWTRFFGFGTVHLVLLATVGVLECRLRRDGSRRV